MHRPAGEGGEAGAKNYASICQIGIGNHAIGKQLLNPLN